MPVSYNGETIYPAQKPQVALLLTIQDAVLVAVAPFANNSAACTHAAVDVPTHATTVVPCGPVTSPAKLPVKFVAFVEQVAHDAVPVKLPVIFAHTPQVKHWTCDVAPVVAPVANTAPDREVR